MHGQPSVKIFNFCIHFYEMYLFLKPRETICKFRITLVCCNKPAADLRFKESLNQAVNPLNPELNPICYLLALLAYHVLHVSGIRVKSLTLRLLMSYIWSTYS
jgi:hypothetical protein